MGREKECMEKDERMEEGRMVGAVWLIIVCGFHSKCTKNICFTKEERENAKKQKEECHEEKKQKEAKNNECTERKNPRTKVSHKMIMNADNRT